MVRHVGRTKACQVCRTRKIKCDEKYPTCTQCAQSRRRCPGAVQGNVFLQLNPANTQEYVRQDEGAAIVKKKKDDNVPDADEACRFVIYTPDTTIFIQNQLISPLLLFWTDGGADYKWQARFADMIDAPAWRCSLLGASLLFHKQFVGEERCLVEYPKYYIKSLRYQNSRMQRICERGAPATFDDAVHTMILAYTEGMGATSAHATQYHISAAASLLNRLGPAHCQTGMPWSLFLDLRVLVACISITEWKPAVFASRRWMTVPFENKTKTSYDLIGDFLLLLPVVFSNQRQDASLLRKDQDSLAEKLATIWDKLMQENPLLITGTAPFSCTETACNGQWHYLVPPITNYPGEMNLISLTLYSMAWIVFLTKASATAASGSYDELLVAHSSIILHHAQRLDIRRGGEYVFTLVALKVIVRTSPSPSQRESATRIMRKGAQETGLAGMLDSTILNLGSSE